MITRVKLTRNFNPDFPPDLIGVGRCDDKGEWDLTAYRGKMIIKKKKISDGRVEYLVEAPRLHGVPQTIAHFVGDGKETPDDIKDQAITMSFPTSGGGLVLVREKAKGGKK